MKFQMFILLVLIIGACFFQPTYQYRLSKRELTEYDLTGFIVSTCSADKIDMLIQNLCDQTLQSALMGNFPFLAYYCNTIGAGMSFCQNINQYVVVNQNAGAKRFVYRRFVRSLNEDNNKLYRKEQQDMDIETDLEQKLIMQICITKPEKSSIDIDEFCHRTLQEVQRGRYPEIKRLCKYHSGYDYCRQVWSYSSSFSWPLSKSSSYMQIPSTHSNTHYIKPSFVSSSVSKLSDNDSINNQQRNNQQK